MDDGEENALRGMDVLNERPTGSSGLLSWTRERKGIGSRGPQRDPLTQPECTGVTVSPTRSTPELSPVTMNSRQVP